MRVISLKLVLALLVLALAGSAVTGSARGKKRAPRTGEAAPLFSLPRIHGEGEVDLADLVGQRPIILFFGSYT